MIRISCNPFYERANEYVIKSIINISNLKWTIYWALFVDGNAGEIEKHQPALP